MKRLCTSAGKYLRNLKRRQDCALRFIAVRKDDLIRVRVLRKRKDSIRIGSLLYLRVSRRNTSLSVIGYRYG